MTQRGIVEKIDGTQITVSVVKTSMCGDSCASCKGGCKPDNQSVQAVNETGELLHAGDVVQLQTETGKVIGASAVVYLIPLVCLFLVYFLVQSLNQSEIVCALCALGAMLVSLVFLRIFDSYIKRKNALLVRITDILLRKGA